MGKGGRELFVRDVARYSVTAAGLAGHQNSGLEIVVDRTKFLKLPARPASAAYSRFMMVFSAVGSVTNPCSTVGMKTGLTISWGPRYRSSSGTPVETR